MLRNQIKFKVLIAAGVAGLFGAGFSAGMIVDKAEVSRGFAVREQDNQYKFTNPLLECEMSPGVFSELRPFQQAVEELISQFRQQGKITQASVYFRDLNNGPWFGISEDVEFIPASLLKVPLMVMYFKMAELDPAVLQQQVTLENDQVLSFVTQSVEPSQVVEFGKPYTVSELIERMIKYSDNRAQYALMKGLDRSAFIDTLREFGVHLPDQLNPDAQVSVRNYSSFFRVLYNASYLSRYYSEQSLALLAQSDFKDGLSKGLPSKISVAHKFGEREYPGQLKQLHDCGIIYEPKKPYLLCVMTRGHNMDSMSSVISDISKLVYSQVRRAGEPQ